MSFGTGVSNQAVDTPIGEVTPSSGENRSHFYTSGFVWGFDSTKMKEKTYLFHLKIYYLSILNVPDECYSRNTYLMNVILETRT